MKLKGIQPKPIVAIVVSLFLLTACQKKPETKVEAETAAPVATSTPTEAIAADQDAQNTEVDSAPEQADTEPAEPPKADAEAAAAENDETAAENPPSLAGAQVTDVRYKSEDGTTMSVVFETSREGLLNAIVSFDNQPKLTLTAPEGQGNNPTYRSKDGNIELVSHDGGSSIDLIQNGDITNFTAISADAAVITQS